MTSEVTETACAAMAHEALSLLANTLFEAQLLASLARLGVEVRSKLSASCGVEETGEFVV